MTAIIGFSEVNVDADDKHVEYEIKVAVGGIHWTLHKRYSQFLALYEAVRAAALTKGGTRRRTCATHTYTREGELCGGVTSHMQTPNSFLAVSTSACRRTTQTHIPHKTHLHRQPHAHVAHSSLTHLRT